MTARRGVSPFLWLALALPHLAACGGVSCPELEAAPAPGAVQEDVSVLLTDLGAQNVCGAVEGSFVQLVSADSAAEGDGEDDTSLDPPPGTGRLWVQSCSAEDVRGRLRVEISGLGWQWIARESRVLGATFEIEEYVRFRAELTVMGEVRPSYARNTRLLQLTLQPTDPIVASLHPIQPVDLQSKGLWSRLVARVLVAVTGKGMDARARERVTELGTRELRMELREGMAVAVDLCTGHRFASIGAMRAEALPERPAHVGSGRWITTERTHLHPGGLDIAGPWSTDPGDPLHGRVRARGGDVVAQLLCAEQVERLAQAYLRGEPLPRVEVLAEEIVTDGEEGRLQASTEGCDVALVVRPRTRQSTPVLVENVLWAPTASIPPTRRFLHTEIQTETRDLVTIPNLLLVTSPVRVVRSGTFVSAEVSLGYDVPRWRVEELLRAAAEDAELDDPFVDVMELGDYSVRYRVAGFLPEVAHLLTARSRLRAAAMDSLHEGGVEIVSPTFMNQRQLDPARRVVPPGRGPRAAEKIEPAPEEVIFDKAEIAASRERLRLELEDLEARLEELRHAKPEDELGRARVEREIGRTQERRDRIVSVLEQERA